MSHILTCEQVDKKLIFYLDQALAPSERLLIEQHLAGCPNCQGRLAVTAAARNVAAEALQSLAGKAEPSAQAWELLQNRLAREAHPSPALKEKVWNVRKAPRADRTSILHTLIGVSKMNKRTLYSSLMAAVAVVAVVGIFLTRSAAPVSAQQIIQKAYQASSAPQSAEGIRHTISENYTNPLIQSEGNWAETIRSESYVDLATGIYRSVSTDAETGELLRVAAYDGVTMFTNRETESMEKGKSPLTIYRTPQSLDKITGLNPTAGPIDEKAFFENMKNQTGVIAVSEETRKDGRRVFVLHTNVPDGAGEKFGIEGLAGESVVTVDAESYDLLEDSLVMKGEDGKETLLTSYRVLVNEILPPGSTVVWDLLDVEGINFMDDPDRIYGDLLPEKITLEELAQHTAAAYLLENTPEGFELELSAPPQQTNETEYFWMANYRNPDGDYLLVQSGGEVPASVIAAATDTYQTKSGLMLRIEVHDENLPEGMKPELLAYVSDPQGAQFMISSNLPQERVVELAEGLVLVK